MRHRIGGRFWRVDFEQVGDAVLPQYDSLIASLTEAPEGIAPLLRVCPAPAQANLVWPLPLRYDDEIHCPRGPETRIYFVDGLLCFGKLHGAPAEVYVGAPPGNLFKGVVGAGILYRLAQSGVLSLHASAVASRSGAILVLGASGLGKSTLAAAWMHIGQVISDDHVLVSLDVAETPIAWVEPFRADIYLRHDGIGLIPEAARAHIEDGSTKVRLPRAQAREYFCECAPLVALVILEPEGRTAASIMHPLSQAEMLLAIVAANSYLSVGPRLAPPALWLAASELASRMPAFRLSVGSDLLHRPEHAVRSLRDLIDGNLRRLQSSCIH